MYDRKTVEELNQLSLDVFGSKSRWRKLVDRGTTEVIMEDTTCLHPDGTKEIVQTPCIHVGKSGGELQQQKLYAIHLKVLKKKCFPLKNNEMTCLLYF